MHSSTAHGTGRDHMMGCAELNAAVSFPLTALRSIRYVTQGQGRYRRSYWMLVSCAATLVPALANTVSQVESSQLSPR
jgi:hypothetical protein